MASTRNINMPGEYRMQQAALEARRAHVAYEGSTVSEATYFPGDGLLAGRVGSTRLAHNAPDVEAFLFGVGSTNLVEPAAPPDLRLLPLKSLSVISRRDAVLPAPLTVRPAQRPRPIE